MKPFTSILVDPNNDNRAMFKTAVRAMREFGEIFMAAKLDEAMDRIDSSRAPWDLVFISYRIKGDEVTPFLSALRDSPQAAETAVIQIFKQGDSSSAKIATTVAQGFNGILCEPFSTDGLKDCAMQAVQLRVKGTKERIRLAIGVIIPVVAKNIQKEGGKMQQLVIREQKEIAESCKTLRELANYCGSNYEAMINEVFDDLKKGAKDEYSGVSRRIKDKFALEGNVQEQLRQELLAIK